MMNFNCQYICLAVSAILRQWGISLCWLNVVKTLHIFDTCSLYTGSHAVRQRLLCYSGWLLRHHWAEGKLAVVTVKTPVKRTNWSQKPFYCSHIPETPQYNWCHWDQIFPVMKTPEKEEVLSPQPPHPPTPTIFFKNAQAQFFKLF